VIDPGVLEIDDEPIAARELDTDAQRSQLRDHLLGLPATLRENLVPPLLPGHGSRLVPNNDRPAAERGDRSRPSRIEAIHTPVVTLRGVCAPTCLVLGRRAVPESPWAHARLREDPGNPLHWSRHLPRFGLRSYCISGMLARPSGIRSGVGRADERERKCAQPPGGRFDTHRMLEVAND
jgi:hypothetical protein